MNPRHDRSDVTVWAQGGLGNQLFQLNAGLISSSRLGAGLSISRVSYLRDRKRRYELGPLTKDVQTEPLLRSLWMKFPYENGLVRGYTARGNRRISTSISDALAGDLLVGYFQDQASIAFGSEPTVRRLQAFNLSERAASLRASMRDRVVAHVRRADYVSLESSRRTFGELTPKYYQLALEELGANLRDVFFFSDDPPYVQSAFGVPSEHVITSETLPSPLETLIVMGSARAIVIPNSSFSWWASELIASSGGRVVAPDLWFLDRGEEMSPSLSHWTRVQNC